MRLLPGVYINLPEHIYFDVDAIGSSDLKTLLRATADWWYGSRHNIDREMPKDDSQARIMGRALHALMLEGEQAYAGRITVAPDPKDYPEALVTTDQIKAWLKAREIPFLSKAAKPELVQIATASGAQVWDNIIAAHKEDVELYGKMPMLPRQDRALRHMAQLVEEQPSIGQALRVGLPEVSVFFERDDAPGVLFRARFDSVAPNMTIDLKTLSNWKGRTVKDMARRQVEEFEYDIQRRFYDEAREHMRKFITNGQVYVFDATLDEGEFYDAEALEPEQRDTLEKIAANPKWLWVWLFYQLRDDKAHKAPIIIPRFHLPHGEIWDEAGRKIDAAIANYQDFVSRFGLEQPWCHIEEAEELEDQDLAGLRFKTAV